LARHGFTDVAINVHYRAEQIVGAIGEARHGVRVRYSREERLLGTAGALRRLLPWMAGERHVLVAYGDLLLDHDLSDMLAEHARTRADATLMVHERPGSNSLVALDDEKRVVGFIERPTEDERARHPFPWTNSGVALVGTHLVEALPDDTVLDLPRDVYVPGVSTRRFFGHPLRGYRCAIDSPSRYEEACEAVRSGKYRRA
jgi:NDP-sugar pyrophosphorylase family protein